MVNPAAFLAYTCSALLLLPRGKIWGSHAHFLHQNRSILAKRARSPSPCRFRHTQHCTTISISRKNRSWRRGRFKLLPSLVATMPTTTPLPVAFSVAFAARRWGAMVCVDMIVIGGTQYLFYVIPRRIFGEASFFLRKQIILS